MADYGCGKIHYYECDGEEQVPCGKDGMCPECAELYKKLYDAVMDTYNADDVDVMDSAWGKATVALAAIERREKEREDG